MKQTETAVLLKTIKTAYPFFEITTEVVKLWHEFLKDIPVHQAQSNLKEHIRSNKFAPTIADIVRHDPDQYVNHEQLKLETDQRFAEMEQWERLKIPCPDHLIPKFLKEGDDNERSDS